MMQQGHWKCRETQGIDSAWQEDLQEAILIVILSKRYRKKKRERSELGRGGLREEEGKEYVFAVCFWK